MVRRSRLDAASSTDKPCCVAKLRIWLNASALAAYSRENSSRDTHRPCRAPTSSGRLRLTMTETRTWSLGGIAPTTRAAAGNGRRVKGSETRGEFDDEDCIGGVPPILVLILKRCRTRGM